MTYRSPASRQLYAGPFYDSHAHLVSDDQQRYPRNPFPPRPRDKPSPFPPGTVGLPGGGHGPSPVNEKPTAEQMAKWMVELNVGGIAAVQKGMLYRTDNSYIVDAAALFPDRMRAVIIVDPGAPETPAMMRALAGRGAVAIRFFGVGVEDKAAWLTSPQALTVWALAEELGLHVDIEAPVVGGAALAPTVEAMSDRFPDLHIVLDHLFMPVLTDPNHGIDKSFAGLAARSNVFLKFTSINLDFAREAGVDPAKVLRRAVNVYGAGRIMWGSDIGTSSGTYEEMIDRAVASSQLLTHDERTAVLHDTGHRVFARRR